MIGYYAHHHGSGHITRAASISSALDEKCTVLSSRPRPSEYDDIDWLALPLDVPAEIDETSTPLDPTAGGTVHWAPHGVRGLTERMAIIAEWVARTQPRLVVVDVSVEVALFVRLLGVPVVVMAMPGDRTDGPHQLAFTIASAIIAPWSRAVYDPVSLASHGEKTTYVGAISRFAGRRDDKTELGRQAVVVLGGAGGTSLTPQDIADAAGSNPEYTWHAAGLDETTWVADVWPLLRSASVVVTHAGQNAIADVACAQVPAIVIPQHRPYREQEATASALESARIAVVARSWPTADSWRPLLDQAITLGGDGWRRVESSGAADRAARVLSGTFPR